MSSARRAHAALRVDLTLPVTRVGFGPFSVDPVEQMIGAPVADILESLMVGPVQRRPSEAGPAVDVYPLALPHGEGASVPLGAWGEIGFYNDGGLLVLTTPLPLRSWVAARLADSVVAGPTDEPSSDRMSRVARWWVRLRPGSRAALPIGGLGELGIEAL